MRALEYRGVFRVSGREHLTPYRDRNTIHTPLTWEAKSVSHGRVEHGTWMKVQVDTWKNGWISENALKS